MSYVWYLVVGLCIYGSSDVGVLCCVCVVVWVYMSVS